MMTVSLYLYDAELTKWNSLTVLWIRQSQSDDLNPTTSIRRSRSDDLDPTIRQSDDPAIRRSFSDVDVCLLSSLVLSRLALPLVSRPNLTSLLRVGDQLDLSLGSRWWPQERTNLVRRTPAQCSMFRHRKGQRKSEVRSPTSTLKNGDNLIMTTFGQVFWGRRLSSSDVGDFFFKIFSKFLYSASLPARGDPLSARGDFLLAATFSKVFSKALKPSRLNSWCRLHHG